MWLILGVVLLYCLKVQTERLVTIHGEYAAETARLARAEVLLGQQDWPGLLEAERAANRVLEAALWEAETEGLAQAKLQAALTGALAGLKLQDYRIRSGVSQPAPDLPGIWRVQIRLDAAYQPGVELQVLYALATHPRKLIVDRLDLRRRVQGNSYMTLILSGYFVGVDSGRKQ